MAVGQVGSTSVTVIHLPVLRVSSDLEKSRSISRNLEQYEREYGGGAGGVDVGDGNSSIYLEGLE